MAVESGQVEQVEELFAGLGPIRTRRMFGGLGVYCGEMFFALADDGAIYLKCDAENRDAFEAAGCAPFTFEGKDGELQVMSYRRLPEAAYDDPDEALHWGRLGLDAALRAAAAKRARPAKGGSKR